MASPLPNVAPDNGNGVGLSIHGFSSIDINRDGLPGTGTALDITGAVIYYSLILVLVGLVLTAGLWAIGAFSNNHTQNVNGKKGFLVCAACALAIGGAYVLMAWFYNTGSTVS